MAFCKNMFTSKKEMEYLHSVGIFTELKLSYVDMYMWSCTNIKIMKNVEYRVTFDTIFKYIHTEVSFRVIPCLAFKVIE